MYACANIHTYVHTYTHTYMCIYIHTYTCHVQILQMFSLSYGQMFIKTNFKLGDTCPKNSIFFAHLLLAFQDVCKGGKYWKLVPLLGRCPVSQQPIVNSLSSPFNHTKTCTLKTPCCSLLPKLVGQQGISRNQNL